MNRGTHRAGSVIGRLLFVFWMVAAQLLIVTPRAALAAGLTVNSTADAADANPGDGLCQTATPGQCTLRAAIQEANAIAGADTISFAIAGAGVKTIAPGADLPAISEALTIDGYTQPGAAANTYWGASDATLLIELNGANLRSTGLTVAAPGVTVRGLVINRFLSNGILISGASNATIVGNYIGTDAAGLADLSSAVGVRVNSPSTGTVVGSSSPADRNVISGNSEGVALWGSGVDIANPGVSGTLIQGNYIGVGSDGLTALPNSGGGIVIRNYASGNTIGGPNDGEGNIIANSGTYAVTMFSGYRNAIVGNSIYNSATGPLYLSLVGANDAGDPDSSVGAQRANDGQNYPLLSSASITSTDLTVNYSIDSLPANSAYPIAIDFYKADDAASGAGEVFLGRRTIAAPGSTGVTIEGAAAYTLEPGDPIVAMATDANGNSSLFSPVVAVGGAIFTVTSNTDAPDATPGDGACATAGAVCTLRAAIQEANALAGFDKIVFAIADAPPYTISPQSALPQIVQPLVIDGLTQPGASCASWPPTLNVELDGSGAGGTDGLFIDFGADGSVVRGLAINRFQSSGIQIANSSYTRVECNYLGTATDGTTAQGNGQAGVMIQQDSRNNRIGGPLLSQRNLVAGNVQYQVNLDNFSSAPTNTLIENNYIGTDKTGTSGLGSATFGGVRLFGAVDTTISNNLIAGQSASSGIVAGGDSGRQVTGTVIQGNRIGTNAGGAAAISNSQGIDLGGSAGSNQEYVSGSLIGTNGDGINDAAEGNLVAGNTNTAIIISGDVGTGTASANVIAGNLIGTDASGTALLSNGQETLVINGATDTRIGTDGNGIADAAERNIITGGGVELVWIIGGSANTVVAGNYIGTDATGLVGFNTGGYGVELSGAGPTRVGTDGNDVADAAEANVLSGNGIGVAVSLSSGAVIAGNVIGVGPDGITAVPNTTGVSVSGDSTDVRIGSVNAEAAEANLIAANTGSGVEVIGAGTWGVRIAGNSIRDNGGLGIDLGADGPTANDANDADSGPNNLQNYPLLSGATLNGSDLSVDFSIDSLDSFSNYPIAIDFYKADSAAGGEGALYLGSASAPSDGSFSANLLGVAALGVVAGDPIVATATDALGISSEFSAVALVGGNAAQAGPTFTVNSAADPGDGTCTALDCTLREAIAAANGQAGPNTIDFAIPGAGPHTIALASALPNVSEQLTIDGLTQAGASCAAWPPALQIEVNAAGGGGWGFVVTGGPFTMRGLVLNRYPNDGVFLDSTASGNSFECNFIGTNVAGTAALGSGQSAIFANGANNNVIGGTSISQRNLISGANSFEQLRMASSSGNIIQGNYIGTDVTGAALPSGVTSSSRAILITGSNNQIGGTAGTTPGSACTGACNVIVGASAYQIWISAPGITANVVQGNYIGVNAAGTAALGDLQADAGVQIDSGAQNTTIGGSTPAARNVIGGTQKGVAILGVTTTGTVIQGNYIGVNAAGTAAIPNIVGVDLLDFTTGTTIGGSNPGEGNVLSGNTSWGMRFSRSNGNTLAGNIIGLGADGSTIIGNGAYGVFLEGVGADNAQNNLIGGASLAAGNIISGNGLDGINVGANIGSNTIQNNRIGTDSSGASARPNGRHGINMVSDATGVHVFDNLITGNAGSGVLIAGDSASDNNLRRNAIYGNGLTEIDLGGTAGTSTGDGVTFNHQGVIVGPNGYQNFPVITRATSDGTTTRVAGTLTAAPGQLFAIDVFANQTCDPSAFGGGQTLQGTFFVGTDDAGNASFDQIIGPGLPEGYGLSATATAQGGAGSSSEFSYCHPVSTPNLNWLEAQQLTLSPVSASSVGVTAQQLILDRFQEKWFKFPVQPGDKVRVTLTSQPGSAITLHRDPTPFYNGLSNPSSAAVLSAAAADTAFLPSQSLPSQSLPSQSLPSQSLPSQSLPSQSLPSQSLPSGFLPSGTLPSQSLPSQSLPSQSLPSQSLPSQSLPEAYSGAARRSLMAAALDPYATTQTIERNTYDLQENLYVRVVGPYDPANPFTLQVEVEGGVCSAVQPVPGAFQTVANGGSLPSALRTLILTDRSRLNGDGASVAQAMLDLEALAGRSEIAGAVVDLGEIIGGSPLFPRVAWANAQADQYAACPSAKNIVAREIKALVDAYRAQSPNMEYIVLAGGADVIPFFQTADLAGLASETEYVPPVRPSTPSEASLKVGLVLGQDTYGASTELVSGDHTLTIPDLAVGRLVDTAGEISAAVDAYNAAGGVIVPHSALVTGYDFVGDAAAQINDEMNAGLNSRPDTLIQAPGLPPSDASAWTADALRAQLLGARHDIAVLSGHFSAGNLLAADYRTQLAASELSGADNLSNMLIMALGCHSGYSLPGADLLSGSSPDPDWARAFLSRGAAGFVAATGYAYGDTELTEYGERLFVGLSQQLRTGSGPVSIGKALVAAKQRYLAETAQLSGIDEKTLTEMTLYGLPMMRIDMPGQRINPVAETSIVGATTAAANGPGADVGLSSTTVVLTPNLTTQTKSLENLDTGATVTATYLEGDNGVVANPFEPIFPKELYNVSRSGLALRGVALRGGSYSDMSGVIPLTTAPATETSRANQSYETESFYPGQIWVSNYYDALSGGPTRLIAVPAQYKSRAPGAIDGTLRSYSSLNLALYYMPEDWPSQSSQRAAAVAAAPTILAASATESGGAVTFSVNVLGDGVAGVQQVWVLYTATSGPLYGQWRPLDLTRPDPDLDPTLWTGSLTLPQGAAAETMQFMAEAVSGAGLTTLATNLGAYYPVTAEGQTPVTPAATQLALLNTPSAGAYLQDATFRAAVSSGGAPLSGAPVLFSLGGLSAQALTDANGVAQVTLRPIIAPGDYTVEATFRGDAAYSRSSAGAPFSVERDSTSITLSPLSVTVTAGAPTPFSATLRDSSGRGLGGKSLVFVVSGGGQTVARAVTTDFWGGAALGGLDLPAGSYSVAVYFSGSIPVGGGQTLSLSDTYYDSSSRLGGALTVGATDSTPPVITPSVTGTLGQNGWYVSDVTVGWDVTDAESAVTSPACDPTTIGADTAGAVVSCSATSAGGTATEQVTIKRDATAPETQLDGSPDALTNSTAASFSFSGTDSGSGLAGFSCSLDGADPADCSSPLSYSGLADGGHTFSVAATDNAGNVDPNQVEFSWVVDTSEPDTLIDSRPDPYVNTAAASFSFRSTKGGSSFECSLDGAPFAACESPLSYSGLPDGSHTFAVRAIDQVGNVDATPASVTWEIDTGPASVVFGAYPTLTNSRTASFTFSSDKPNSSFECSLDNAPFVSCSSPLLYTGLSDGPHSLTVRATDTFGVTWPGATAEWTVDTVAPETTINTGPPALTNSPEAMLTFNSEGGSSLECKLDGGDWVDCASPKSYSGLEDGEHTFMARATDAAGNVEPDPPSYVWAVDATPPETSITDQPPAVTTGTSASFSFVSDEAGAAFSCSLDGAAFATCSSPLTYTNLSSGGHTFAVRAVDLAGNVDPTAASYSWTINTAANDTTITSGPPALSRSTAASFRFRSDKPGASFECKLDAGSWAACSSPKSYSNLAQGSHTFMVRAIDPAGNADPTPASYSWTVDTIAPETSIIDQPADPTTARSASFSFTGSEVGGSFQCKLDGGSWQACASPKRYTNLKLGSHTFMVRAIDAAGNTDPTPASYSWTIKAAYQFSGFLAPVKDPPALNRVKAGSVVPVRFSLNGNFGKDIFAPGYPLVRQVACGAQPGAEHEVDETETPGFERLLYNKRTGRYIYLWKTDRDWSGTCQQLVFRFNDGGPEYVANFKFVR